MILLFTNSDSNFPVPKYKDANVILLLANLHISNNVP